MPQGLFLESFLYRDRWGAANQFKLFGNNAIRNDQFYGGMLARGVRLRLDAEYRQLPHLFSQIARNGFFEAAPGLFLLPDSLQARHQANSAGFNASMADFLAKAPRTDLAFRTDNSRGRLRARPLRGWRLQADVVRRQRAGRMGYAAGIGTSPGNFNAVEFPMPVDQRMLEGDLSADYRGRKLSVQTGVGFSSFDNHVSTLRWDNMRRLTDASTGPAQGQFDFFPDNSVMRARAGLTYDLARRTSVSAFLSAARGTQDDPFLPYTINTAIPQSSLDSLPARSLDGEAVRTTAELRLNTRVLRGVDGMVRARHEKYDNKTPQYLFSGMSPGDQNFSGDLIENHPFGHEKTTYGLELGWSPVRRLRVSGGYELRRRLHTFREIDDDRENAFDARARYHGPRDIELSLWARHSVRVAEEFHLEEYFDPFTGGAIENPLVRRFDVANRRQDRVDAGISVPLTSRIDLGFEYNFLENRFPDTPLGLQNWRQHGGVVQASFRPVDRLSLAGGYGAAYPRWRQVSHQQSGAAPNPANDFDWQAYIKDRANYGFANLGWWARPSKLQLLAGYTFSRDQTSYRLTNTPGTAQDVPETFYRRHMAELQARWLLRADTEIGVRYNYDEEDIRDWANQGLPLFLATSATLSTVFLGDNVHYYHANRIAVLATRRF